jgi:supervillin
VCFAYVCVIMHNVRVRVQEGRKEGEEVSVQDLYERLTETKYTWQQLQERPLPEGVNPLKLEFYLEDSEFEVRVELMLK